MMKKIISLIMAIIISVLCIVPAYADDNNNFTSGDYEYKLNRDDNAVITKYNGSEKNVKIPSKLDGYTVAELESALFLNCTSVETVTVPDTVTKLSGCTFFGCTSLTDIYLGSGLTSALSKSFVKCTSLKYIHVDKDNPFFYDIDGVLFRKDGEYTMIICYPAAKEGETYHIPEEVNYLPSYAFSDSQNLKAIVVTGEIKVVRDKVTFTAYDYEVHDTGYSSWDGGFNDIPIYGFYGTVMYEMDKSNEIFINYRILELGDINGDGKVTALDSLLVQRASINAIKLDDKQKECAQIYRTEGFGNVDAMVILMYSIGLLKDERDSLYKTRKICDEYNITWGNQNRNN